MNKALAKTMLLTTVIFMDLLTGMEFDIFVPSFPEIQSHFNLSAFWVEALLSANFLGYCLSFFFVGNLADRYGRKPIILVGLLTFIIGSISCLAFNSYATFLLGRFLQGIGIAAPSILSFLIIADSYPLKQQQFFMAMLNGSMNIAVAIAPVLGSYIALYFHWQGNFIMLLFLGLLTLLMTILFIPYTKLSTAKQSADSQGYRAILQNKSLMLLILCILFIFVPYWIFAGMSPLLYIKSLGVSLAHFGYYQGVLALAFAIGSILHGVVLRSYDYAQKKMLRLTNQIFLLSLITIGYVTIVNCNNPLLLTLSFLPFVIGQIIPSTILYPLCLNFMPQAMGRVSAMIQGIKLIFTSIGLQVAGYFYLGSFQNIGIILIIFISAAVTLLYFVMKNNELMATV